MGSCFYLQALPAKSLINTCNVVSSQYELYRPKPRKPTTHVYLDEAGDISFYGKKKRPLLLGENGVSKHFMLGLLHVDGDRDIVVQNFSNLLDSIAKDTFLEGVPSHQKRKLKGKRYWAHAKDDHEVVRYRIFSWLQTAPIRFSAVVLTKDLIDYEKCFGAERGKLYSHLFSHIVKPFCTRSDRVVFHVSSLSTTTSQKRLENALTVVSERFAGSEAGLFSATPDFQLDIQNQSELVLLGAADYCTWALQKIFASGEARYLKTISNVFESVTILDRKAGCKESSTTFSDTNTLIQYLQNKKSPRVR